MTNIKFIKTLTSAVILSAAIYSQAYAACPSGYTRDSSSNLCVKTNACNGNCTYYYNDTTYDFEAKVNDGVAAGTPVLMNQVALGGTNMHNAKIGEGITGFAGAYVFFNLGASNGRGTLTLPSTFKDDGNHEYIHTSNFQTFDLSAMKDTGLKIGSDSSYNIILNDDANLRLRTYCPYSNCAPAVDITCKGDKTACRSQLKSIYGGNISTQVTTSYYSGQDENGNYIEWSDDGLAVYVDSTKAKPLGAYDFDGNQTGIYKYDAGGNLISASLNGVSLYKKTSYTPAEAAAAIKKGNNNKVTLTFK